MMTVGDRAYRVRNMAPLSAKQPFGATDDPTVDRFRQYREMGQAAIAAPFKGITSDGHTLPGLYRLEQTGISTEPVRQAADNFLASLDSEQRRLAMFGLEADEWRAWSNIHPFVMRHGVALDDCADDQRARALELVRATCSARGYQLARDIMKLNDALAEITGRRDEYGEWYYWLSIFGEPSAERPWGWQIDGHHLVINCLVLRDQLVMSPTFFGSEPTSVDSGTHAGTRVFDDETRKGLDLVQGFSGGLLAKAAPISTSGILRPQRMDGRIQAAAFRDNIEVPYAGLRASELDRAGSARLLDLVALYTGRMRDGHAALRLTEIERHLADTYFLWVGGISDDAVFYYRIQSPVVLIEFDHLSGIAFDNDDPSRNHVHTVVRTPNGNDYGKDLLRQHYAQHHTAASVVEAHRSKLQSRSSSA